MIPKNRPLFALLFAAALAGSAGLAQAQQPAQEAWARVISVTPAPESTGNVGYDVSYEYQGRQYTTRMDRRPGSHIAVQANAYGVTTTPVQPQSRIDSDRLGEAQPGSAPQAWSAPPSDPNAPWDRVAPEPGVVVSRGGGAPAAPVYVAPPVYVQPAPVYVAPPVYVRPAYAWPQPYIYPPVGISLNLGYSRGWGGGHYHHRHRGWR